MEGSVECTTVIWWQTEAQRVTGLSTQPVAYTERVPVMLLILSVDVQQITQHTQTQILNFIIKIIITLL